MITSVSSGCPHGVDAFRVDLEADFSRSGIPAFVMVGLVEGAAREARDRVFAALRSSGFKLPPGRITVNLAPADRKKQGAAFDLPLAVALVAASGKLEPAATEGFFMVGELSLTGELRPVSGVLPVAILARDCGARGILVPAANAREAAVVDGLRVFPVENLAQATGFLSGQTPIDPLEPGPCLENRGKPAWHMDYADVKGQEFAKRACEIAAAGGHNLMFVGPPGSGKTMLARRLPSILPPLTFEESLEVTKIYSVAGLLAPDAGLVDQRPFRSPHHTVSHPALVGGGSFPRPGEISLAHNGVLFLDELPEYSRHTLETLRQPLEGGQITVSRTAHTLTYPAGFMLVAAMNPCPCGYATDAARDCICSEADVKRYRAKLSGPLLDRIDMQIEVPALPYKDLRGDLPRRSSAEMAGNVLRARETQLKRSGKLNAALFGKDLETHCCLGKEEHSFMEQAVDSLALSARAHTRILRLARTVADLEGTPALNVSHLAEAVNCRVFDRHE